MSGMMAVVLLSVFGLAIWLSAIVGFGIIAAPHVHRQLPRPDAGKLASAMLERAHLVGWYGGLLNLTAIIVYSTVVSTAAAELSFVIWSMPAILATIIWWASWKKVLPRAEALRAAIAAAEESEELSEATSLFDDIHRLSVNLWKGCTILLLISIVGLSMLLT